MNRLHFIVVMLTLLSACTPAPAPTPTTIPTPALTATQIPEPITGTIFWDANGSGLRDDTSFIMPEFDPSDPPYFFELLAANGTGLGNLSPGDLATVPEPPIPAMQVCLGDICTETDKTGVFTLQPDKAQSTHYLTFTDPSADDPAKAFRYINKWNGPVVIESYEINGVTIPTQHLNDTEVIYIDQGITISPDQEIKIGLMQGFLTLPFSRFSDHFLWSYVDLDYRIGEKEFIRNWAGEKTPSRPPTIKIDDPKATSGISDNHQGIDYYLYNGTSLLAMSTANVLQSSHEYHSVRLGHYIGGRVYVTGYGHNQANLVDDGDETLRGQTFALSGDWHNGKFGGTNPHVHASFWVIPSNWYSNPLFYIFDSGDRETIPYPSALGYVWTVDDPYRDLSNEKDLNYWTVDNIPQFPLVEIIE